MSRKQPLHFSHSPHPTTHTYIHTRHTHTHTHTHTRAHTHLPPSFLLSSVHLSQRRYHLHRPSEEFQERSRQDRTEQNRTGQDRTWQARQDVQHATPLLVLCRHMSLLTTAGTSDTCTPTAHSVGTTSGPTTPRVASAGFPLDKAVSRQDRR